MSNNIAVIDILNLILFLVAGLLVHDEENGAIMV